MAGHNSLFISRTLLQVEHSELRRHMVDMNHAMPDTTIQWRRLGEVGVMLVQSSEYESLASLPGGRLRNRPVSQVVKDLNNNFLHGRNQNNVSLGGAAYLGNNTGDYVHVGYTIPPEYLIDERNEMTAQLEKMNRIKGDWLYRFDPFLSIATVPRVAADDEVLAAFQEIMPDTATLHGARAHIS